MSDPHESRGREDDPPTPEKPDVPDTPEIVDAGVPEIIDAEVVDPTWRESSNPASSNPASSNTDVTLSADEAASYQQFLEFQKFRQFQEWQRQHGTAPTSEPPTAPRAARPWWKRALLLLRFKAVRRLLYLVVVLFLLYAGYEHYFGGRGSHDRTAENHVPGNENPALSPVQGANPADAVKAVYSSIATNAPAVVCAEFSPQAGTQFATASGAPDCPTAVRQLNGQVTNPTDYTDNAFTAFQFNPDAVTVTGNGQAEVPACRLAVAGGPQLGSFHLHQLPNRGWQIDGYQGPPPQCPPN